MSNKPYCLAVKKKFYLYLLDNGLINEENNWSMPKKDLASIFTTKFKPESKAKVSASFALSFRKHRYLKGRPIDNVYVFDREKLAKLYRERNEIDQQVKEMKYLKRKTLVDHSVVYRAPRREEPAFTAGTECLLCNKHFHNDQQLNFHCATDGVHQFHLSFRQRLKNPVPPSHKIFEFAVENAHSLSSIIVRSNQLSVVNLKVQSLKPVQVTIVQIEYIAGLTEVQPKGWTFPIVFKPNESKMLSFEVLLKCNGTLYYPMIFKVNQDGPSASDADDSPSTSVSNKKSFEIPVHLVFHAHSAELDVLHPTAPPQRRKPIVREFIQNVDRGRRPKALPSKFVPTTFIKEYPIPNETIAVLNTGLKQFDGMTEGQRLRLHELTELFDVPNKTNCLTQENYAKMLETLLFIEELQMRKEIRDYDRDDQVLEQTNQHQMLRLTVPGLAESRPSVVRGDSVYVREEKNNPDVYQGFVHKVEGTSVLLGFSPRFLNTVYQPHKRYFVYFDYNRGPIKTEHQAVELAQSHGLIKYFFPSIDDIPPHSYDPNFADNIDWFNANIENNPQQQQAVKCILDKASFPYPYLLFGPPGTGKTMTLVEAIKQIWRRGDDNILVCAPSNSAANEIAKKLTDHIPIDQMFRYLAMSFPYTLIPAEVLPFSNYKLGEFYHPSIEDLKQKKILIITLTTASKLFNGGLTHGHFGYVFVDEAGHTTESQTLIPIAGICSTKNEPGRLFSQLVLAGDPKQLGPVIHSSLAKSFGFDKSMLERLMNTCSVYKKDMATHRYNANAVTKLVKNYRSHPAIIHKPNEFFYDNELEACGDELVTNLCVGWEGLPNREIPVIYHNVPYGLDMREGDSPSFFNIQECAVVFRYLERLIGSTIKGRKIEASDIAVISPYKKQVQKILRYCLPRYPDLTVGSVEQIQGQERLIVIVSMVRSRPEFLAVDNRFHLGFIKSPKRFNVAVTRAKALFIAVGNANMLQHDEQWREMIAYCLEKGAWAGESFEFCGPVQEERAAQELAKAMEDVCIVEGEEDEKSTGRVQTEGTKGEASRSCATQ